MSGTDCQCKTRTAVGAQYGGADPSVVSGGGSYHPAPTLVDEVRSALRAPLVGFGVEPPGAVEVGNTRAARRRRGQPWRPFGPNPRDRQRARAGKVTVALPQGRQLAPRRPTSGPAVDRVKKVAPPKPKPKPKAADPSKLTAEEAQMLADIEAIVEWLGTMDDESMMAVLSDPENAWLVAFLTDIGLLSQPGTMVAGTSIPKEVRQADDIFSSIWDAVKGVVPGGQAIDTLHQARRTAMYGPQRKFQPDAVIQEMQGLSRRKRKGDPGAVDAVRRLKEGAVRGDDMARRKWHVYVAVTRDDQRRIDAA